MCFCSMVVVLGHEKPNFSLLTAGNKFVEIPVPPLLSLQRGGTGEAKIPVYSLPPCQVSSMEAVVQTQIYLAWYLYSASAGCQV